MDLFPWASTMKVRESHGIYPQLAKAYRTPSGGIAAVADVRDILKVVGIPLAGFAGAPEFGPEHIVFNGRAPDSCEPFEIARIEFDRRGANTIRSFCKTEHRAYDLCVKIALVILAHHLKDFITVGSDGSNADWADAKRIVNQQFGYGGDFRLRSAD